MNDFPTSTNNFQNHSNQWQLTLASSYNLIRIIFYFCLILVFPFLIIKSEGLTQKYFWIGIYIILFFFGTLAILPTMRRLFFMLNYLPKDFLQVNQYGMSLPRNYIRPYSKSLSDELLHIPIDSVIKINYLDQIARSQERQVSIQYRLPNGDENKFLLYNSDFLNGREDLEAFFEYFVGKVPTERIEFLR